jgi:hypothetical protein
MGEHDHLDGRFGHGQMPGQPHGPGLDVDLLVTYGRVVCRSIGRYRHNGSASPLQACGDLIVGRLGEVCIELPDAEERFRRVDADELVGVACEAVGPIRRRHRDGQDDAGRSLRPGDLAGGSGGRPGGDAVVDHDDGLSVEPDWGPVAPEPPGPPLQFDPFPPLYRSQFVRRDASQPDHAGVQDPHAALADGAHPQFRLERHPQFADNDDVEWRVQRPCHF